MKKLTIFACLMTVSAYAYADVYDCTLAMIEDVPTTVVLEKKTNEIEDFGGISTYKYVPVRSETINKVENCGSTGGAYGTYEGDYRVAAYTCEVSHPVKSFSINTEVAECFEDEESGHNNCFLKIDGSQELAMADQDLGKGLGVIRTSWFADLSYDLKNPMKSVIGLQGEFQEALQIGTSDSSATTSSVGLDLPMGLPFFSAVLDIMTGRTFSTDSVDGKSLKVYSSFHHKSELNCVKR